MLRALAALVVASLALLSWQALAAPESQTNTVPPARIAERNIELKEGDRVVWHIAVQPANATPIRWDIHSHDPVDRTTFETHEEGYINGTGSVEGTFLVPATKLYSWYVLNAFRLPIEVTFTTDVNPTAPPANPVPGPEVLLLAGAALAALLLARPRRPRPARC